MHVGAPRIVCAALALTLMPLSAAHAQSSDLEKRAAAQALFEDGRRLTGEGKHAQACPKFAESNKLDPAIGTLFYLAECFENTGKLASAWTLYVDVADQARAAGQADRATFARTRAEALRPRLSRLTIVVSDAARSTPGLKVQRDGVAVGQAQWGTTIPVDAGKHVVVATAPSRRKFEATIEVKAEGEDLSVTVPALVDPTTAPEVGPAAAPPLAPTSGAPEAPPDQPPPSGTSPLRTAGFVVGGVGVAGIVIGTVAGIVAMGAQSDSDEHCDSDDACDPTGLTLRDDAISAATVSTVAFVVGGVALGAGVVLVLASPRKDAPGAGTLKLGLGPSGATLAGRW
jgi:hypothetical protein